MNKTQAQLNTAACAGPLLKDTIVSRRNTCHANRDSNLIYPGLTVALDLPRLAPIARGLSSCWMQGLGV